MWRVFSEPFMNANLIFPTQQKDVYKIIQKYKEDSNVMKIIIFGISVTSACNPWSDIDVYVELNKEKRLPAIGLRDVALDVWTNFMVDKYLMEEINERGVVVYERDFT